MTTTIRNQHTGTVPTDHSVEASRERALLRSTLCTAEAGTVPPKAHFLTYEQALELMRPLKGDSRKRQIAQSLIQQYDMKRSLSAAQQELALRIYGELWDVLRAAAELASRHDWKHIGSTVWYNNTVLGTYSASDYYECSKCHLISETYEANNYSGD